MLQSQNLIELDIFTDYSKPPILTRPTPVMPAVRKGKRKRQNANAELTQELAALIYASESEDSEKEEWGEREWEVKKITGEAVDMCGRRE